MTYLLLWRAIDKPTLFESDEFESYTQAKAAMDDCHQKYPWNNYLVANIVTAVRGTGKIPSPFDGITFVTEETK